MQIHLKVITPFLLFSLLLSGCFGGQVIINNHSFERPACASAKDPLTLRIFNDSQHEISSVLLKTTGCDTYFSGFEQGETSCPIPVEPFYANFDFEVYIHRTSMISNLWTREDAPSDDNRLITEGDYQLSFKVEGKGHRLRLVYFRFEEV